VVSWSHECERRRGATTGVFGIVTCRGEHTSATPAITRSSVMRVARMTGNASLAAAHAAVGSNCPPPPPPRCL
jgi:hypothetical protein